MTDDAAWDRIMDAIDAKFGISEHGRGKRPLTDAHEYEETFQFITFERSGQRLRLERTTGPAIIDRKTIGARRAGATITYQNVYDPSATSHKTHLYRFEAGDWLELDPSALEL